MVVVRDRVTVDRMDDRTENKGPLTGDAVPVTRLLTTSHGRLSRCRIGFIPGATIIPNSTAHSDSVGDQWRCGPVCSHRSILARRTTYRTCKRFRKNIEQATMYSCTVRMLLLPCPNLPNVELNPRVSVRSDRMGYNPAPLTSNSLPSRMYPSLRPLCPGRLEMAAYRRPAPN